MKAYSKGFSSGMNYIIEEIQKYSAKYDDYDRKDKLSLRERMANENARIILSDLSEKMKAAAVDAMITADKAAEDEEKEQADVGINGNGEVSAKTVCTSRLRPAETLSQIHTGLPKD